MYLKQTVFRGNTVLNLLYSDISTLRSMCSVPNMAVFCSSLILCFPGTLLRYFMNDFKLVPVAPVIADFTYHHYHLLLVNSNNNNNNNNSSSRV